MDDLNGIHLKILEAKETRWNFQMKLLTIHQQPIISFKFNIPSWPKLSEEIQQTFDYTLTDFQTFLQKKNIDYKFLNQNITVLGPEAFFTSPHSAEELKQVSISFEENYIIGRLIDIDIINISGSVIDRKVKRRCFLCNKIAIDCMREQLHTQKELKDFFDKKIKNYLLKK
ncbi:MAG: citrate lyase holo-[acyl-carrier protein] synthase [Candidatus Heimdallarchaeota archaeon]|nr:citrate lyase holo-[acyl-carrier protein] synthase [Candidatus Heimdallarchaeota archaeon]